MANNVTGHDSVRKATQRQEHQDSTNTEPTNIIDSLKFCRKPILWNGTICPSSYPHQECSTIIFQYIALQNCQFCVTCDMTKVKYLQHRPRLLWWNYNTQADSQVFSQVFQRCFLSYKYYILDGGNFSTASGRSLESFLYNLKPHYKVAANFPLSQYKPPSVAWEQGYYFFNTGD